MCYIAHGLRGNSFIPSECLLLQTVQETTRVTCRVTTSTGLNSGFIAGLDPFYPEQRPEVDRVRTLMDEWKKDLTKLRSWIDWSVWV